MKNIRKIYIKSICFILSLCFVFAMTACSSATKNEEVETISTGDVSLGEIVFASGNTKPIEPGSSEKLLISIFSKTGDNTISWMVANNSSSDTYIKDSELFVAKNEKSNKITVTAIAAADVTQKSEMKVSIKQKETKKADKDKKAEKETEETKEASRNVSPSLAPLGHVHSYNVEYVSPTCTGKGYTKHYCSCGNSYTDGHSNPLGHSYSLVSTTPATCSTPGAKKYVCSRCGDSYIENTSTTSHRFSTSHVSATCQHGGYTVHKCTVCGYSYNSDETAPVAHNFTTVISGNTAYIKCTYCGYVSESYDIN